MVNESHSRSLGGRKKKKQKTCTICSLMPHVCVFHVKHEVKFKAVLDLQQVTGGPGLQRKHCTCSTAQRFELPSFSISMFLFGNRLSRLPRLWNPFSCFFSSFFFSRLSAFCSFSSAAHLVGYYAKEMESIAERWVMLFTGKSDDQRQGITPSRSDVSWKIPFVSQGGRKSTESLGDVCSWPPQRLCGKGRRTK